MIPTRFDPMGGQPYLRKLSYLESTGTQYINTGCKPDFAGGDSTCLRFYRANYTGLQPCIFGSRESGVRNAFYCLAVSCTIADADGYDDILIVSEIGDHVLSVNDSVITCDNTDWTMPRRVTVGLPIFLFALNNYGTGTFGIYSGMKLYEWKYWRNGSLAQHLIPVLDKSGVPCLYDCCTRAFFYNAGSGTFNYA